jgi:hypothetical protein
MIAKPRANKFSCGDIIWRARFHAKSIATAVMPPSFLRNLSHATEYKYG